MTTAATPVEIHDICSRYGAGESCHTIAAAYSRTAPGILRILKKAGVPVARSGEKQAMRKMTHEITEKADALYQSGHSLAEVGAALGVTPVAVSRGLRKHGYTTRPKKRTAAWSGEETAGVLKCSVCLLLKPSHGFTDNPAKIGGSPRKQKAYACKECNK